jgi:transcriptional regulator with GAF, ATPase, and Fis domain
VSDFRPREWETRPLAGRAVYTLPVCTLSRGDSTSPERFHLNRVTIGSDAGNHVVLADDTVSRFHAEIVRRGDGYLLRDLESTNGTCVDGVRIVEAFLSPGANLTVGEARLRFAPDTEVVQIAPAGRDRLGDLVGRSEAMRRLFHLLEQVAPTDATILIEGETGTGKEVVARTLHELSHRRQRPFVVVDCSAIPASLMESELFGHEKGSFSGAIAGRMGLFEMAQGGTVFLDEIGELPLELQPKLLRVLESGEIRRVGAHRKLSLDVRFVAATNRTLGEEIEAGRFRRDLFFRLNVIPVHLPALRERPEDVPLLVGHILATAPFNDAGGGARHLDSIARRAADALVAHLFPGNVRELVNLLERAVSLRDPAMEFLSSGPLPAPPLRAEVERPRPSAIQPFKAAKEELVVGFEREYLPALLEASRGNLTRAARLAGLDRKHLRQLLKKHGLHGSSESRRREEGE